MRTPRGGGWGVTPSKDSEGNSISDYTHLGDKDDATYIDNVLAALDMIDQLNAIRKAEGLSDLKVSLSAMVEAAYHANWSAETNNIGHASQYGYSQQWGGSNKAENAAWGSTATDGKGDFFTVWYYQEKADYTGEPQTDPSTGVTFPPTPGKKGDAENAGHYLNIIGDYAYTGMAVATDMPYFGTSAVNVFGSNDILGRRANKDKSYTTDELRSLIAQAKAEGVTRYHFENFGIVYEDDSTIKNEIAQLEAELASLQSQLETAKGTVSDKQAALTGAQNNLAAAQQALNNHGERPTNESLQQAVTDAQTALEQAKADKANADQNLAQVKADSEKTQAELAVQKSKLQTELDQANAKIDGLKQAADDASSALNDAKNRNQAVIDTGNAYRTAQGNLTTAQTVRDEAQKTADDLTQAVAAAESDIADAQKALDDAKTAYDAAGPTDEQKEDLAQAEAALKAATDELTALTSARDDAQKLASDAQDAVDANAALMEQLADSIDEQQGLIDDATTKLPVASGKVDAWTAVLEQQEPEDIVKNGFTGAIADAEIAGKLGDAHDAYADKLQELEQAKAKLDAATKALEAAKANKATTTEELAAAIADHTAAKNAYDKVKAEVDARLAQESESEAPVQQAAMKTSPATETAGDSDLLQTGDPASVMAAAAALAGMAALAGGAHFRRRRDEE